MKFLHFTVYLPAIDWAIIIFILSTKATVQLPDVGLSVDKVGHFVAYALQVYFLLWARNKAQQLEVNFVVWTVLAVSFYGILLECIQWAFFPGRFFEVWDMIANITGASISGILSLRFFSKNEV